MTVDSMTYYLFWTVTDPFPEKRNMSFPGKLCKKLEPSSKEQLHTREEEAMTQRLKAQQNISAEINKPLPQGPSGSLLGIIGGLVAALLLIIAAVSAFVVRRKKQKQRSDTDSDMTDLPPTHKPAPPPKKKPEMKTPLTAHDIQVVHLDPVKAKEEIITLPIQTTYYDLSASDNSPYCEKRRFGEHCPQISEVRNFLSARCSHEEEYLDQLHPAYVPLSFYLQDSIARQTPEPNFCYAPPAGSRAPYVCPKEQYV